jgi:hypothetical protein
MCDEYMQDICDLRNSAVEFHKSHAQRLADKLTEVLTFVGHKPSCRGGGYGVQPCDCGAQALIPKAREALAEWSKQK